MTGIHLLAAHPQEDLDGRDQPGPKQRSIGLGKPE
jgi:hypothetical protein